VTDSSTPNPYAPPKADVADIPEAATLPWFPVSGLKFVLMSAATFTFYQVYWFYKNWKRYQDRSGQSLMPFLRALFAIFFCKSLFDLITEESAPHVDSPPSGDLLAIGWIVTTVLLNIAARFETQGALLAMLALLVLSGFFFLPILKAAEQHNAAVDPGFDRNSRLGGWNILGLVVGALFFGLIIVGSFVTE
jgi:hypothetical protein